MQASEQPATLLAGTIAGGLARHCTAALVSAPPWILATSAALFAITAFQAAPRADKPALRVDRVSAFLFLVGMALSALLPLDPPQTAVFVTTHALTRSHTSAVARPSADMDLYSVLETLDEHPEALIGRRIAVSGWWQPPHAGSFATVSQRVMSCCAADAVDVGFDVQPAQEVTLAPRTWVGVSGIVRVWLRDGETRYALVEARVQSLSARSNGAM